MEPIGFKKYNLGERQVLSEQGFPPLSSVLRANAEQVTESHVRCTAHFVRSTLKFNFTLFRPKCSPPTLSKFGHNYKTQ